MADLLFLRESPLSAWRMDPDRILIRAPNWVGDCVMAMPAVQRIRERFTKAHIALLAKTKVLDVWRNNPHLDEVLPHTDLGLLPEKKFDLAILFPNSFRSAWEAYRAGIPRRVGYSGHWRRWLLTDVVPGNWHRPTETHFVHHYLKIGKHLDASDAPCPPRIVLLPGELDEADRLLGATEGPLCAMAPGAEYGPAKRWLPERFVQVAKQTDCTWVIVGGPHDAEVCNPIADALGPKAINLVGKTTLRQLCALLARCRVLLSNDSGAMHVGSAVGTRVVAVFGSTDPAATGPVGDAHATIRHKVDCSPCFLRECPIDFRCMKRIEVSEVARAVARGLETHRSERSESVDGE